MIRVNLISRTAIILIFAYLVTLGAAWNGVLTPAYQPFTLGLMAALAGFWLWVRRRDGWHWQSPIAWWLIVLWLLVIAISVISNIETWRRSAIGLWYMGVYVGTFYVLYDCVLNRGVRRESLINAFLFTGAVILFFGLWQVVNQIQAGTWSFTQSRPVSIVGNTNALAAFLMMLIPFSMLKVMTTRLALERYVMVAYTLAGLLLILLTFSRGAWIGVGVALAVAGILLLIDRDLLSRRRISETWAKQSNLTRWMMRLGTLITIIAVILVLVVFIRSFSIGGRTSDLRTRLWISALDQFSTKPLTGHGFFTFGRGYMLAISQPPENMHSHAHSVPLNIMAELGLPGLFALITSVIVILRMLYGYWRAVPPRERRVFIMAVASLAGFAGQHLFDLPAMMPMIALVAIMIFVVAIAPYEHSKAQSSSWMIRGIASLWIFLILIGFWSSNVYREYFDTVAYAVESEDYAGAAAQLDQVIKADPYMPIYYQQQAFLWGMAARDGDDEQAHKAITSFESFLEYEPHHAISWANKAALHWQVGESNEAINAMEQAVKLAPDLELFRRNLAIYQGKSDVEVVPADGDLTVRDFQHGVNVGYFQFLRQVVSRQYLPQLGDDHSDDNLAN